MVVGLNIKSAPVETLEKLSIHHSQNALCLSDLKTAAGLQGAVILSTCNRLEFYAVGRDSSNSLAVMREFLVGQNRVPSIRKQNDLLKHVYIYSGNQAIRHLFRVVAGLDSMVLGETEIPGQVARAYETARNAGATDKIINVWFQKALSAGKKVRFETHLDQYSTSVGRIAVDLAVQELGSIQEQQVLILGAGEMSELTMKHLVARSVSLVMVSNRSLARARSLAIEHGFEAYPLTELAHCLKRADLVFSATASKSPIVSRDMLAEVMERRPRRPLLFIDMAVPRDIDPSVNSLKGVRRFDIKDLHDVADKHRKQRELAASKIESIIDEKVAEFGRWLDSLELMPTITALRQQAEQIKTSKLNRALGKLSTLNPEQHNVIQAMANSIVNQLLYQPITTLNDMAGTPEGQGCAHALRHLFQLQTEGAANQAETDWTTANLENVS
ncbi:MAG: glutamyl-tRNA reductase [Coriobacteriales bacterium]|jgi:glutamyl-tRNA reductase|nr:glutamyl-tRNA reductase [Coriobacteriales bacterium]